MSYFKLLMLLLFNKIKIKKSYAFSSTVNVIVFLPLGFLNFFFFNKYCKFGNFRVTFISRIFDFRIISEFLNSRASTCAVHKAYNNSLLARTLFSRGIEFANISEN